MLKLFRVPTSLGVAAVFVVAAGAGRAAQGAAGGAPQGRGATAAATSPARATATTAPPPRSTDDAAPFYRYAADLLGDQDVPDSDAPLDGAVAKFLATNKPALECLDHAAALKRSDWLPNELTDTALLGRLRRLSSAGMLRARYDFAHGLKAGAQGAAKERPVDELLAVAALGRHLGQAKLMLSSLVDIGIETAAADELARHLPALGPELAATIPRRLDALPPAVPFGDIILGEHAYALALTRKGQAPGQPWDEKAVQESKPFYDAIVKVAALPPEEFSRAVDAEVQKLQPGRAQMFAQVVAGPLKPLRVPTATLEAKLAMLRTAAEVVATGPDAVTRSKDPFGDGPFKYAPHASGFRLESKLVARKKAVELVVGESPTSAAAKPR